MQVFSPGARERTSQFLKRLRSRSGSGDIARHGRAFHRDLSARAHQFAARFFKRDLPPMSISPVKSPMLLVLMAGTTIRQYEEAAQTGRFSASLERYSRHFRSVVLMTTDRSGYTETIALPRVRHLPVNVPAPLRGSALLLMSVAFHFRTVRQATSVLVMDEKASPAGWFVSRLSRSELSMSIGAPWTPPRKGNTGGFRNRLLRMAMDRVTTVIEWPECEVLPVAPSAKTHRLPALVDVDLFCPLATTDPARPRTVGVFIDSGDEVYARVMIGVSERLKRRRQDVVIRVFVVSKNHDADAKAAALQGEARERDASVEFLSLPPVEILPDAIARMRLCVSFGHGAPTGYLLRAMASGVPGIAIAPKHGKAVHEPQTGPDWTYFVLNSGATEEEITRNIEMLFREPGVRLRLAREGRRFVVARHSVAALAEQEALVLLRSGASQETLEVESEFDAQAEAKKLSMMLAAVAETGTVIGPDVGQDREPGGLAA